MKRFFTLLKTELKLSLRSFDAVFFGILMPVIIIGVIGLIYQNKNTAGEPGMLEMTFGAFISIGICATGLMSLPLVLSDYRGKKILKRFKVTPAHPGLLLGVQIAVQFLMASISAIAVTLSAVLFFGYTMEGSVISLLTSFILVMAAIFSIGLVVASLAPDMKKAGFICSILYFPMLLFSGTTIPFSVFPKAVQRAAEFLPLTQGIKLLNGISMGGSFGDYPLQLAVLSLLAVAGILLSVKFFKWDLD